MRSCLVGFCSLFLGTILFLSAPSATFGKSATTKNIWSDEILGGKNTETYLSSGLDSAQKNEIINFGAETEKLFGNIIGYVIGLQGQPLPSQWVNEADRTYSYLRDLLTRLTVINGSWKCYDYLLKDGSYLFHNGGSTHVFVIRRGDGVIFRGSLRRLPIGSDERLEDLEWIKVKRWDGKPLEGTVGIIKTSSCLIPLKEVANQNH